MKIWVDADACPVVIKEILYKAADRAKLNTIFVANRNIKLPKSNYLKITIVSSGLNVADNEIEKNVAPGDLVITSDIPLAAKIVAKGAIGLNARGETYTTENIREKLSSRDFMDALRSSGVETGGPAALTNRDKQLFANALDKSINQLKK